MPEGRTCEVRVVESLSYRGNTFREGQTYEVDLDTASTLIGAGYATEARIRDAEHSPTISDSEEIDRAGILPIVGLAPEGADSKERKEVVPNG